MKRIVLALSAVALLSGSAFAGTIVRQKEVSFAGLNLASKDGAAELQARLLDAANEVCADTKEAVAAPNFDECRKNAMQHAIADVGAKLTKRIAAAR